MKITPKNALLIILLLYNQVVFAQKKDSTDLDYNKIYAYALDADIQSVLNILNENYLAPLTKKALSTKKKFEDRFLYEEDRSGFLEERRSALDEVFKVYRDYWRLSLLQPKKNYDSILYSNLSQVLTKSFQKSTPIKKDSFHFYLKQIINNAGYYTTGFGKTGKLFDLLIWKEQYDTTYNFKIKKEKIKTKVVFMDIFLTLGWEEYATLGRNYPGGWATKEALFCVKKAYNTKSENFLISYLAHEGTHFSDYKKFPGLTGYELEYRAKLVELSLAKESVYRVLTNFINNSNNNSENPHSKANFSVVKDLSNEVFGKEAETNIKKWEAVDIKTINDKAYALFKKNTKLLKKK